MKNNEIDFEKCALTPRVFRAGQREAIETLMEQGRLLCIQPTGHGKSLVYQIPASMLPGVTVVISPLLALMRDQCQQLNHRFKVPAASINSDQSDEENFLVQRKANLGELKILFVAPEKLDNLHYFEFLIALPINLIVIDEAHCISTWGHDFRPSYRQIIQFVHEVEAKQPETRVLALTATANEKTAEDIKHQLGSMRTKAIPVQRQSMDRPNIKLSVIKVHSVATKLFCVQQLLQQLPGTGLIYCATRENTEIVADFLQNQGVQAAAYHAGFPPDEKKRLQQQFLDSDFKVMTATNALGMGIDKQDLRFIIHFDVPGSITAYYQEVGRCGRDGKPAEGILLFDEEDKKIQQHFINSAQPTPEDFSNLQAVISEAEPEQGLNLQTIKRRSGLHPTRVLVVVSELAEQGFIEKKLIGRRQVYLSSSKEEEPDLSRYIIQQQVRKHELRAMLMYGDSNNHCLMSTLRKTLGEKEVNDCGTCSNCQRIQKIKLDIQGINDIERWLNKRTILIGAVKTNNIASGVAVLNAQVRSPLFIEFMHKRAKEPETINPELLHLIQKSLDSLNKQYNLKSIVVIPSRTWAGRYALAKVIAHYLQIPCLLEHLNWRKVPEARQGELLNNDQRRYNVDQCMELKVGQKIPPGDVLLLDDYIGSGATIKEAARVLRKQAMVHSNIIPFTVAAVKWRLGKAGMV